MTTFSNSAFIGILLLALSHIGSAAWAEDGKQDKTALSTCATINYAHLPAQLTKFMKQQGCTVTSDSVYNVGSRVDLNADGNPEYAFCCQEAPHGPCDMRLFARIDGRWAIVSDGFSGYMRDTPCSEFTILASRHEGFNDICFNEDGETLSFKDGRYR